MLCGASHAGVAHGLCAGCAAGLPANARACPRCALPSPASPDQLCGRCLRRAPPYHRLLAPFLYAPPVDSLIAGLKFRQRLHIARMLGEAFAERVAAGTVGPRPDRLVPVPLHPHRLRERGFNQALELARPLCSRLGIPLALGALSRQRPTAPQSDLPARQRRRNVEGAFATPGRLPWRHVALVDDVVTTGHTVEQASLALQRAGVEIVEVWACARALPGTQKWK